MSYSKKRKLDTSSWNALQKMYNAGMLANETTEQFKQIQTLEGQNQSLEGQIININNQLLFEKQQNCKIEQYSIQEKQALRLELESVSHQEKQALQFELESVSHQEKQALRLELESVSHQEKQALRLELESVSHQEKQALQFELESLKINIDDQRNELSKLQTRKKMWKHKFEELAKLQSQAMAKIHLNTYGCSIEQYNAFKSIAQTQMRVDEAQKERNEAIQLFQPTLLDR